MRLYREELKAIELLREYAAECEDDEDLKVDLLEGATNLMEAIDRVEAEISKRKGWANHLRAQKKEADARIARLENSAQRMTNGLRNTLRVIGLQKLERPAFTLSVRSLPPKVEIDETRSDRIPEEYWTKPEPTLDKRKLLSDLKAGQEIPGARLNCGGESLTIRRR